MVAAIFASSVMACGDDTSGIGGSGGAGGSGSGTSSSPNTTGTGTGSTGTSAPGSSGVTGTGTGTGTGSNATGSSGTENGSTGSMGPVSGTDASVTGDAAANSAAENAVAAGMFQFVRPVPCASLTIDRVVEASADGFAPHISSIRAGGILRFSPSGDFDMRSVRGEFITPLGDESCLLFQRPGTYVFDSSSHPEMLGIVVVTN